MTVDQTPTAMPNRAEAEETIKHITDNAGRIFSWDYTPRARNGRDASLAANGCSAPQGKRAVRTAPGVQQSWPHS